MAYYHYRTGVLVPFINKFYKQIIVVFVALFIASMAGMSMNTSAATVNGCTFTETPGVWTLDANCTSTAQINIPTGITLDGAGNTISASFPKTDNSNNSAIGIQSNNVTIQNLTIDGTGGSPYPFGLHGINVYTSTGIVIDNVTLQNMTYSGLVVNGSTVSVSNVSTSGNGWSGIGVDLGSGVTTPAVLNIVGTMTQSDLAQIYVDDITKNVTVNDVLSQYNVSHPGVKPNDRLYTLKVVLTNKDACKKNGWKLSELPVFKNQGQCVAYFASNGANIH